MEECDKSRGREGADSKLAAPSSAIRYQRQLSEEFGTKRCMGARAAPHGAFPSIDAEMGVHSLRVVPRLAYTASGSRPPISLHTSKSL